MPSKVCCSSRRCDAHSTTGQSVKEFVIIGNGPSGISLSYLLSGNWPYYLGGCQDEMLHARLTAQPHLSLLQQDLEFLSDGLEGRSNNPVSLLFDALQRPEADLGLDLPSLLEWRQLPHKRVDHVVLGRGGPGGVWRTLDGGLLTVSLGAWMQLPNLSMESWEANHLASKLRDGKGELLSRRTSISCVAQYYTDYVEVMGLAENFRNYTVVTNVKQLSNRAGRQQRASAMRKTSCAGCSCPGCPAMAERLGLAPSGSAPADPARRRSPGGSGRWALPCPADGSAEDRLGHFAEAEHGSGRTSKGPISCPGAPPGGMEWKEDLFLLEEEEEEEELSSGCSSLTRHSESPDRGCASGDAVTTTQLCDVKTTLWEPSSARDSGDPARTSCCDDGDSGMYSISQPLDITNSTFETDLCPSWDPILNPSLCSFMYRGGLSSSSACFFMEGGCQDRLSTTPRSSMCSRLAALPEAENTLFEVSGYEIKQQTKTGEQITEPFSYLTKNVVLATGHDKPNRLNVEGEGLAFVLHSLRELERAVESGSITTNSDPVMIIGAGLSAADAILNAQGHGIPVVHVFRRAVDDPQLIFNKLPVALYPEYHRVHQMMGEGSVASTRVVRGQLVEKEHPGYRSYAQTAVMEICKGRRVRLSGPNTNEEIQVSLVVVLVGAAPDLEFLETDTQLGQVPGNPIDKNNPIDIDVYSHQAVHVPGLFAMGPLTGDNFVRFLQGGALAIAAHAQKRRTEGDSSSE